MTAPLPTQHTPLFPIKRVGIALAAYNPPPAVFAEQLKSIQIQTHTDWICWITLDSSLSPLKDDPSLRPYFEDSRFQWSENAIRLGHKKNFEHAMNLAAADASIQAIACSDQDDIWYPTKLQRCVEELSKIGPNALVHTDMHVLNSDGTTANQTAWEIEKRGVHNATVETLLIRNVVAGCAMLIDANLVRKWPTIPDAFEYHDHWYAVVAAAHTGAHPIYEPLYAYRQHGGNVVGVSPFLGVLNIPKEKRSPIEILKKLRRGSEHSLALSRSVFDHKLLIGPTMQLQLGALDPRSPRFIRGLKILFLAIRSYGKDLPLLRAALARGLGSILGVG